MSSVRGKEVSSPSKEDRGMEGEKEEGGGCRKQE
jgi:hypothetical protein